MKTSKYKNIPTLVREGRTTIPLQKKKSLKEKRRYTARSQYIYILGGPRSRPKGSSVRLCIETLDVCLAISFQGNFYSKILNTLVPFLSAHIPFLSIFVGNSPRNGWSCSMIGEGGDTTIPSPGRSPKQLLPGIGLQDPLHGRQACPELIQLIPPGSWSDMSPVGAIFVPSRPKTGTNLFPPLSPPNRWTGWWDINFKTTR